MALKASLVDTLLVRISLFFFSPSRSLSLTLWLVSFAGLGFLALYIAGKMNMFDEKGVSKTVYKIYKSVEFIKNRIIAYV